jgi:FkbM family methyltransferase
VAEDDRAAAARLCDFLGPERITFVDAGASGGVAKRWRAIAPALRVVAFEPDLRSGVGEANRDSSIVLVRKALAGGVGRRTMYLTRKPQTSSLYRPQMDVRRRFTDPERADILDEMEMDCTTIDAALAEVGIAGPDFIKIDTQGTELDVLRGADRALTSALGLEIEVEFLPLYHGAALFRDVDAHVSRFGFELYDLRRTFFRRAAEPPVNQAKGQLAFGDALYFRDWHEVAADRSRLARLAATLLVYGYADVVSEITTAATSLSDADGEALRGIMARLTPASVPAERKDSITGAGFQLF